LLCDPHGEFVPHSPTVIQLARQKAMDLIARLPEQNSDQVCKRREEYLRKLAAPPEMSPHYLASDTGKAIPVPGGVLAKVSFNSEDGEPILGLLWLPQVRTGATRTVIIADSRGKQAVAQSDLVRPLIEWGLAVLAVDLRGRGETLGHIKPEWDTNFRLVANQVELGQPLPGRRAFDLQRAIDYVHAQPLLTTDDLIVVGIGDDGLSALVAAAADSRVRAVVVSGYFHSFISQMRPMTPSGNDLSEGWNDAQLKGILKTPEYDIDLGSVIPSVLLTLDLPDLVAQVAPRKVFFCQARDANVPGSEALVARFRKVNASVHGDWLRYAPDQNLDGARLRDWIQNRGGQ